MSVNTGFSFAISSDRLKVFLKEVEQSKSKANSSMSHLPALCPVFTLES